jgi:hypothetical protein
MERSSASRIAELTAALAAVAVVFLGMVEPWFSRWGATEAELHQPLPGDEIISRAASQVTRAISFDAPVAVVWPWLAQIGRDRGGFYSFDLLENLVGCEMPTVDRLRPDEQSWKIGDKLWMYPEHKAGGAGFATLRTYVPGRVLGFATRAFGVTLAEPENGSWTFVLEPVDKGATRLLIRGRMAPGRALGWRIFDRLVFEPAHFVMERRMMLGLKQLAEGRPRSRAENHVQTALWVLAFVLVITAVILAGRNHFWLRGVAGVVAATAVFQILTLGQPSIGAGILLLGIVVLTLPWKKYSNVAAAFWTLRTGTHLL